LTAGFQTRRRKLLLREAYPPGVVKHERIRLTTIDQRSQLVAEPQRQRDRPRLMALWHALHELPFDVCERTPDTEASALQVNVTNALRSRSLDPV